MTVHSSHSAADAAPHQSGGPCRMCGKELQHSFVDLGMHPLCESFVPADKLDGMEPFFPLHTYVCDSCFLVQLKAFESVTFGRCSDVPLKLEILFGIVPKTPLVAAVVEEGQTEEEISEAKALADAQEQITLV